MMIGTPKLRVHDDDTLLDMYDHAHDIGDEQCDAIAAELRWRGIDVAPCGHPHVGARQSANQINLGN